MNKRVIKGLIIGAVVLILFAVFNPFSINDAGNRQVIQKLSGKLTVRFEPGIYYSGPFSKVTTYPNNITCQISPETKRSPNANYWSPPNTGTFAEGDQAKMGSTVKWDLPNKSDIMIKLHKTYQNIDNLANTTLMQYQRETASYSCQRMTSEAHYSGGQSQLKDYFQDQLRNGQVLLVTETKTNTLDDGTTKTFIIVEEKLDSKGFPLRTKGDVQEFQLTPSFVSIDYIKYDDRIYRKLEEKIDAAADEATSKQRLITAQQEEQTAIVEGRKLIAEVTAKQESIEAEEVIKARKAKLVEKENAEKAKYTAEKIIQEKRAEAEANRLLVNAGLTPQQEMDMNIQIADKVSKNLSTIQFPQMMIIGNSSNGGNINPFDAVGLESFMRINKEFINNSKKN